MKALYLIVFALLLSLDICENCETQYPEKVSECTDDKIDKYHCCYVIMNGKHKNGSESKTIYCGRLSDDDYNKIDELIEKAKQDYEKKDFEFRAKIDCGSGEKGDSIDDDNKCGANYIIYSLLSLILLFL